MFAKLLSHLRHQYAGFLALFVALGGTSYAVATGSIDGREVKNSSLTGLDVRNNSLTGADVRNLGTADVTDRSLLAKDFKSGQLASGSQGATGPTGASGPTGPQGTQGSPGISGLERVSTTSPSDSSSPKTVVATCPAGKRALSAGADMAGARTGTAPDQQTDIVIDQVAATAPNIVPGFAQVVSFEKDATLSNWSVTVHVMCANVG